MGQIPETEKSQLYQVRVVATNGKRTRDLCWAKVRLKRKEIQCGISSPHYKYHSSYHQSGEIRISREPLLSPLECEPPAVAQIGSGNWIKLPLDKLGNAERVVSFFVLIDDVSLQDYPPFTKKTQLDSIVYVDTRFLTKNAIGISMWVSRPDYFFERMPKPPGFRHISELPSNEMPSLWFIVDVDNGD